MKRPALFLSTLFVAITCSAVIVSTTIAGICKSFYKDDIEKTDNVKIDKVNNDFKEASVRL
jgi:hypothetical protein